MAIVKIKYPGEKERAPENVVALNSHNQRRLKRAADALAELFVWENTVEGEDFWMSVHDRIRQIANNGELK